MTKTGPDLDAGVTEGEGAMPVADVALTCPTCSAPIGESDRFCEACGAELAPAAAAPPQGAPVAAAPVARACHECGGEVAADGYCTQCGAEAVSERDHFVETPAAWVAGVCDRGIRHFRNEDAMALHAGAEQGSHAVLVVCDGVSSSTDSDVASLAAARAARDVLAVSRPQALGTAATRRTATARAMEVAVDAANDAVIRNTTAGPGNPASCTFVAAVLQESELVVGWVGDSRAYWLPDAGAGQLLSIDDSFAAEQIAAGVPRKDAENGPQAHAITRWLGIDAPDHTPRTASLDLSEPGWVMVCSDGLWNYCSEGDAMSALLRDTASATGWAPLDLADGLVDWANAQGGKDNITVTLARVGPATPAPTAPATTPAATTPEPAPAAYQEEGTPDGNVLS
jgi:serine/threonine protein phosphatase PrpC